MVCEGTNNSKSLGNLITGFDFGAAEALATRIGQRGPAGNIFLNDQIGKIHLKPSQFPLQSGVAQASFKPGFEATRRLAVENPRLGLGAEVDGGRLEGVAVVGKSRHRIAVAVPDNMARAEHA